MPQRTFGMPRFSRSGTAEEAIAFQTASEVQDRFRGAWFHVSRNDALLAFDDQHEDWTFFTRSPLGGAIWGQSVLQMYFVEPASASRVNAGGEGDPLGQETGRSLPDWWLFVGEDDIDKLMVVRKYHLVNDEAVAIALRDASEFQAIRQGAVAKLPAPKPPPAKPAEDTQKPA